MIGNIGWEPLGYWCGIWLLLILVNCCNTHSAMDGGPMIVGPENIAVARREVIETGPWLTGTLQPRRQSAIRAEVGGAVERVSVEIGQSVSNGAILARIEARALRDTFESAQSAVRTAKSDVTLARRQLHRVERLVAVGTLAKRDLEKESNAMDAAESRLEEALARLTRAREDLAAATIKAPISGIINQRAIHVGDNVKVGDLLFTIIDPSSMWLEASVPSEELETLTIGRPVIFEIRGYPGQTFTGQIARIAPAADPVTRQISILVSLPNVSGKLVAGLFAEGRIAAKRHLAIVIPFSALEQKEGEGRTTVKRIKKSRVESVPVKLGLRDERTEQVEIISGIQAGDRLLTGAALSIVSGTPIRIEKASINPVK